ncbi:MAG TPA: NAD(P)-dependent oxidoreductase, partial [Steroidobacteraceae bacterium]|nr:NAD(P)-dependent oxidoreductase [Steroidobacteraceae bacterium]
MLKVAFAGLGAMGAPMARNLHRAGLLQAVWNRTPSRAHDLAAELGVRAAQQLAELAEGVDAVVICVSADADVLDVIRQLAPALAPDTLVIDCSTVGADTARIAAALLAKHGVAFLDAPVSGGTEGAERGTLAIMVGGKDADFARAQPVLQAMGKTITHFGPSGAGQATKATNQIMCAGIIRAVAEAMAFAKAN